MSRENQPTVHFCLFSFTDSSLLGKASSGMRQNWF